MGVIARIKTHKGKVDEALALHQEELKTYEALGDRRSRAMTLGYMAIPRRPSSLCRPAIAIAQSQKARSFELRAALALANLYRANNRDADAHAVLAGAVEGFPPTQQFPERTEAQTLLAALSESATVKSAATLRQRRLRLQISLGNALIWTKGLTAPEARAAFARARELASRAEDAAERFSAYWGLWVGHANRGEPAPMRELASFSCAKLWPGRIVPRP